MDRTSVIPADTAGEYAGAQRLWALVPLGAALLYPWLLDGFHAAVAPAIGAPRVALAGLALAGGFLVSVVGFVCAWRMPGPPAARRLAYAAVMAPTLYVFMGVLGYMAKARIPDEHLWTVLWLVCGGIACAARPPAAHGGRRRISRWRVAHGVGAAIIVPFVLFHVANHLFGLGGFAQHDAVRELGEVVYRAPVLEPLLALFLVVQTITGVYLFWYWSSAKRDFFRTFQLASGLFLAVYVIGHMNSVFFFARSYLGTTTSFAWAAGVPDGIVFDAWNIRLLPHYLLGVFFALAHLASGVRGIALAHGCAVRTTNRLWVGAIVGSLATAVLIILIMTGLRLPGAVP